MPPVDLLEKELFVAFVNYSSPKESKGHHLARYQFKMKTILIYSCQLLEINDQFQLEFPSQRMFERTFKRKFRITGMTTEAFRRTVT